MPDISPLSTARKAVSLIVLLGIFAASLGAAEGVILFSRHREIANTWNVNFTLDPKLGFKLVGNSANEQAFQSADGRRTVKVTRFDIPPGAEVELNTLTAERFAEETGRSPLNGVDAPWGRFPGVEIRELRALKHDFTIVRIVQIGQEIVEIDFAGTTRFIDLKDEEMYKGVMSGIKAEPAKE